VDPNSFGSDRFGRVVRINPGRSEFWAFLPTALPTELDLERSTVALVSRADLALGRLAGAGRVLPNPHLLMRSYLTQEALASSRIEGTQASLSDVLAVDGRSDVAGPLREVLNYLAALDYGLDRLKELPVSMRLLKEMHAVLMRGVRGSERSPGELRRSQVWIGSINNGPGDALFVPPPALEMGDALTTFERRIHAATDIPALIDIALLHYQFETIHPFLDGNGRLGRLLITLLLVERGLLPQPLLFLSHYFERRRNDYYDRLQAVREQGQLTEWLNYFLIGVEQLSVQALEQAEGLIDLRDQYRSRLAGDRSRALELVDYLFERPVLTVRHVTERVDCSGQSALNHLRRLESLGIVREVAPANRRAKKWIATELLAILERGN
jgi:Fic family protein